MSVPTQQIVPPPPPPVDITVHRGRKSAEEIETSIPAGRVMHAFESQSFEISGKVIQYRGVIIERLHHDAEHDRLLQMAKRACLDGDSSAAFALIVAAEEADCREDACAALGDEIVDAIHDVARRIAGLVERVCAALVARVRREGAGR